MKTKHITIHRMSPDSIDVLDTIQIEVEVQEAKLTPAIGILNAPEYEPEEVHSVMYENNEISRHICGMFTDDELINNSELETEMSLETIKELAK